MRLPLFDTMFLFVVLGCATPNAENTSQYAPGAPSIYPTFSLAVVAATPPVESATDAVKSDASEKLTADESIPAITQESRSGRRVSSRNREKLISEFFRGSYLEEKRQYDDAREAYAQVLKIAPDSAYAKAAAANTELLNGNPAKAVELAQEALQKNPSATEARRVLGQAFIEQQKWEEAVNEYEKILEVDPRAMDVIEDLAIIYARLQRFDDSIKLYRRLMYLNPVQAVLYQFRVANLLYQLNRFEEALTEYQALSKQLPNYYEILYKIGTSQEILTQTDEAVASYLLALNAARTRQEELMVRQRLGAILRQQGQIDAALEQYKAIADLIPNDTEMRRVLAVLYLELKQYDEALPQVDALLEDLPGDYRLNALRREMLVQLERKQEAYQGYLEAFNTARNQDMEDDLTYLWDLSRDEHLEAMKEHGLLDTYRQAIQEESEKVETAPRYLFAGSKLALAQGDMKALKEWQQEILKAFDQLQSQPDEEKMQNLCFEIRLWQKVRTSFHETGLHNAFIQALDKCQDAYPNLAELDRTLGILAIDEEKWEEAEKHLLQAKENASPDSDVYQDVQYQLASVYEKMNRVKEVELIMRELIENNPEDAQAYNFLGYTYADRGINLEEALSLIEKAHSLRPSDGNIVDSLGWVHFRLGNYDDAVKYLKQAADMEENHPVILDHLGDALDKKGEVQSAVENWKKALEYGPEYPFEFTPEFQVRVEEKIREAETLLKP